MPSSPTNAPLASENGPSDLQDSRIADYTSASGITQTQIAKLPGLSTESGHTFASIELSYMTLGTLNEKKDNAILICHALSGNAHVAGLDPETGRPGWWDFHVGPGKSIDTDRFFVICSNVIGGCHGSTGPTSINPETGKPWRMDFPPVTIRDMVAAQTRLVDWLGIETLFAVIGGSMGGMQALVWALDYPNRVRHAVPIASCMAHSAMQIAFNEVGRQAIINDASWNKGNYTEGNKPDTGLAVARMMGHVTYLSEFSMHQKFGRKLQRPTEPEDIFPDYYTVESYLRHQGQSFVNRFDPNSYLYITKALDRFELFRDRDQRQALKSLQAEFLIISFESDWLYPPSQSREMARIFKRAGKGVSYINLHTPYGHDSFLIYNVEFFRILRGYLNRRHEALSLEEEA